MSTFRGVFTCEECGESKAAHETDVADGGAVTYLCVGRRSVSQPLSRVVAGPSTEGHAEACWTDGDRWTCASGCQSGSAASLIADVAAFRALTPEQRASLLAIGADGPVLLEAARAAAEDPSNRSVVVGLRPPVARIDMRTGRERPHCALVYGPGQVEMPCKHQRIAAEKSS